jgi:hypothetical protein
MKANVAQVFKQSYAAAVNAKAGPKLAKVVVPTANVKSISRPTTLTTASPICQTSDHSCSVTVSTECHCDLAQLRTVFDVNGVDTTHVGPTGYVGSMYIAVARDTLALSTPIEFVLG